MTRTFIGRVVAVGLTLGLASTAHAQTSDRRWSVDFGIGWDNSVSGNINSSTIGSANGQTVVVLTNKYEEVYGTGLHFRIGGGYKLDPSTEARVTLTIQALDADLATLGDYGASPLYADYTDYEGTSLDFGLRRYGRVDTTLRPYAEGSIGLGSSTGLTPSSWRRRPTSVSARTTSTRTRRPLPGPSRAGCSGTSGIASTDSCRLVCAT